MKTLRNLVESTLLFWTVVLGFASLITVHLWPAAFWLEVKDVKAGPARAGEDVPMVVARTIKHPFLGTWTATIRKWDGDGWVVYCAAQGTAQYETGAELPNHLTLDWWTAGRCPFLPAGNYTVGTLWQINPLMPFLPAKSVSAQSNIFEVTP